MKYKSSILSQAINATLFSTIPLSLSVNADVFKEPTLEVSQSDFGGVGLMQAPSGRMAPEGEFNFGVTVNNEYHHASVSLQLLSWFETTIRYTMVQDLLYSSDAGFSGDTEYTDKGIDFKIRLWEESDWLPETSVGVRDFGGTGLFDGEYIAATKRYGNLDFTLGMGWGYLGQRGDISSPLCELSEGFCSRDSSFKGSGGSVDFERWFRGPAAIFGGVEYQTPYEPLRIKVEYEGNDYSNDYPVAEGAVDMTQHTPWNFGLVYSPSYWADIRLSYERGDTVTFGVTAKTNFNELSQPWRDTPKPAYAPGSNAENPDWDKISELLASNAGFEQTQISVEGDTITVRGEPTKYRKLDSAHERAALILSQNRTKDIKTYTFVETNHSMDLRKTSYDADAFDDYANNGYLGAKLDDAKLDSVSQTSQSKESRRSELLSDSVEALDYGIEPTLTQSLGSAETFYFYALGVTGSASYKLTNNLELSGSLYVNLADNYDKFNYTINDAGQIASSSTPRVRTLFRYYVHDNPVRMNNLQLTWLDQLSDSIYYQGYGGYLESMFAGVGGEVLYRPKDSSWAVSIDANYVSQRDPDNWLSVYSDEYFEYGNCASGVYTPQCAAHVLVKGKTGFLNLYYTPEYELLKDTRLKLSMGQFLGQDKGVRMDFSKQFDSGVITGAYASFSNLTADEYGEGSFTKGFYISFPLDILTVKPSRSRAGFIWQPLTRDGGQMLYRKYELFNETDARSPWFTRPAK
ncbi:YjbH domain-containing protein [Vibrio sp. JC009]|uniref:YjbH domain-containing protein n=1 Tax=Vibrio sp. JC009 TaxID=2912314 RepID=UPI0023AFD592|nr:YjbH domain-containing protein [Vibrio sp. JC009]WED24139.1 YjbH domain-containing protein [Vibrio sp. JC009]